MSQTHYLSMIVIGVGSFVFGMLPSGFSLRSNRSYSLFLSLILCLGAGVLLATSLVHMLTEVQAKLKLYAQLYFCGGFLILYAFDEIIHYIIGGKRQEVHNNVNQGGINRYSERDNYGSTHSSNNISEKSPLLNKESCLKKSTSAVDVTGCKRYDQVNGKFRHDDKVDERDLRQVEAGTSLNSNDSDKDVGQCHVDIGKPCASNFVAKTGLLIALLIHSILEGISIGVQTEYTQILIILGAVTFHKIVLAFCLGLELHFHGYKKFSLLVAIALFSVGSPLGILFGMFVTSPGGIYDAQLQAIAAGSLLYVAAFEVLPRERFKWQHKTTKKAAGIFQFIFVLLGFICITALHFFIGSLEHTVVNATEPIPHNQTIMNGLKIFTMSF